jgi:hypothetical protein
MTLKPWAECFLRAAVSTRPCRLSAAKLGAVDYLAEETARACVLIDAALTVRRGLRELPKHDPLITRLVA